MKIKVDVRDPVEGVLAMVARQFFRTDRRLAGHCVLGCLVALQENMSDKDMAQIRKDLEKMQERGQTTISNDDIGEGTLQ